MGQRGRGHRLAETVASRRLRGFAEKVGRGADDRLDRPAKEDEQRLREAVCERRGVGVRCDDSPHDEATRECLRTFHTVSEGEFSEVHMAEQLDREEQEPRGVRYRSLLASSESGTVSACRW